MLNLTFWGYALEEILTGLCINRNLDPARLRHSHLLSRSVGGLTIDGLVPHTHHVNLSRVPWGGAPPVNAGCASLQEPRC